MLFWLIASSVLSYCGFYVVGGAIGISPLQAGLYGLMTSFLTMALGHWIGHHIARLSSKNSDETTIRSSLSNRFRLMLDPSFASGSLLGVLSVMSLHEALSSWTNGVARSKPFSSGTDDPQYEYTPTNIATEQLIWCIRRNSCRRIQLRQMKLQARCGKIEQFSPYSQFASSCLQLLPLESLTMKETTSVLRKKCINSLREQNSAIWFQSNLSNSHSSSLSKTYNHKVQVDHIVTWYTSFIKSI